MSFALFIFLICFFIFSIRRPLWAGIFIISTLPSYLVRFYIGSIPFTLLEGMIWTFVLGSLITNAPGLQFRKKKQINKRNLPFIIMLTLFVLSGFISVFAAPEINAAMGIFRAYIIEAVLFVLMFLLILRRRIEAQDFVFLKTLLYALGTTTVLISLYAIFQKITGFGIPNAFWQAEETRRVTSIFLYPNALGLYLGPIGVLYFGVFATLFKKNVMAKNAAIQQPQATMGLLRLVRNDTKETILSFIVFVLSVLAIVFAVSEGALFGVAAGIFVMILLVLPKKKKSNSTGTRYSAFLLAVVVVIVLLVVPVTRNYLVQKIFLADSSGDIRTTMWSETWELLRERPLLGAGLAGYQKRIAPYHADPMIEIYLYPHNIFLNFWSEMGLLGLISVIGLLILFFMRINSDRREILPRAYQTVLLAIMIQILVHGLVDVPFFKNDLSIIFLMVLMMGIVNFEHQTKHWS